MLSDSLSMEDTVKAHDELNGSGDDCHMLGEDVTELDGDEELPSFEPKPCDAVKLRELLRNINSVEMKLISEGSKEFMKLLRGSSGGKLLQQYVSTSSKLTELLEAWNLRQGKQGLSYILSLISVILDHPEGKYRPNDTGRISVSRVLDRFAKKILEEKMDEVYKELNSKERKRQKAALLLMGAIVRRGSVLAAEVARSFDFTMPIFPKLAEYKRRKGVEWKRKHLTRGAFIEFATSFLEVGKPGLLRWVLQQKEMFSGILRGLGEDDDETVVFVLSTLRDRVLTPESLVSPGLRSVLFGSVTLEQLASISARENGGLSAEIAYNVLVMVCTDPSNGLMPDLNGQPPLRGNLKRLMDLMKKLKAAEIKHHRNLLLAIVSGRPSFGSAYLDEFPYNLEDHSSPNWLSAVSLAVDVVSSVSRGIAWDFLNPQVHDLPSFHGSDVQAVVKCVCPRPFSRLVINKGLLHSDPLVKHGTLKLLLENLKLLDSFIDSVSTHELTSLKQEIQSEVRVLLPDPQVLFALLNTLSGNYNSQRTSLKRVVGSKVASKMSKKLKTDMKDIDIVIGGVNSIGGTDLLQESDNIRDTFNTNEDDNENDHVKTYEICGSHQCSNPADEGNDAEVYLQSNVLEVFRIYHRTLYSVLDVSYDLFKILPSNPLALPSALLQSLLSLLIEHVRQSSKSKCGSLPSFHKYLHPFINLLLYSSSREIKDQAYVLAQAAMLSTGAFDSEPREVDAWFLFLPGYKRDNVHIGVQESELLLNLSPAVVSFLCDAVSSTGNNLIKYWDLVKCHLHQPNGWRDMVVHFSPLVICILEKCLRLLSAESGTFVLGEKTMISLYVSSTLKYVLQTQVEAELLSSLIHCFLSERLDDYFVVADTETIPCEWRPLKYLLLFSQSILHQETCNSLSVDRHAVSSSSSFVSALADAKKILRSGRSRELIGVTKAFYFSLICTTPSEIIENLLSVMEISQMLVGIHPLLAPLFFLDQSLLHSVCKLWPDIFSSGLELSAHGMSSELNQSDYNLHQSPSSSSQIHSNLKLNRVKIAFGSFLKKAPFYLLFPAIVICGYRTDYQKYHLRIKEMLLEKLSRLTSYPLISCLRLVLFWIRQIQLSYRDASAEKLEDFSELCYTLVEHIVSQIQLAKADYSCSIIMDVSVSMQCGQEIAETIFNHPAVVSSLSCTLGYGDGLTVEFLRDSIGGVSFLSGKQVCETDHQILVLLTTVSDYLLGLCSSQKSVTVNNGCKKKIVKAFNMLVKQLFKLFKERFEQCLGSRDLKLVISTLYAILALIRFISPFDLLELVDWMFSRADQEDSTCCETSKVSPISLGFCIAAGAFEMLSKNFLMLDMVGAPNYLFWETKEESFDVKLFGSMYFKAFESSTRFNLDIANICLLKAVNAAASCKYRQDLLPLSMGMARVIAGTPVEILSHCVHRTNPIKAKLLFVLIEMSPLHMSVFGHVFSDILSLAILLKDNVTEDNCKFYLSDEEYLLLLPAALSYQNLACPKYGKLGFKKIEYIPSFYSRILMDGFSNWKSFVSQSIFQVECGDVRPSSTEQLFDLISSSLLAKGVRMLQCHFAVSGVTMTDRLKLFLSICPSPGVVEELLDLSIREIGSASVDQLLNLVNRVFTKIWLCRILLFLEDGQSEICQNQAPDDEDHPVVGYDGEDSLRVRFLDMMVSTWQWIVKKFPYESDYSEGKNDGFLLFKLMEVFILRCISDVIMKMCDSLVQMDSLPFLEKLARFSFLHRFGDPATLEIFGSILSSLSEGNSPIPYFLQLLLGHSQLAPTIQIVAGSSPSNVVGMFPRPVSSILKSLAIHTESSGKSTVNIHQLEAIKLLRVLFHLSHPHRSLMENDVDINSRELLFLLLSSYGATLSEIDLEIYNLMVEIESLEGMDSGALSELDYLWGSAVLRIQSDQAQKDLLSSSMSKTKEQRKIQFRDNLPIDPKLCAATVLYFPFGRTVPHEPLSLDKVRQHGIRNELEASSAGQCYDPVFILRFSIHSLSMDYLDPVEFAGLGLLAIALISISSPEEGIRKLAYEVLGRFKDVLEKSQRKRDVMRLCLLLTYVQNGIEEPWQKIPTIIAVFVAEASVIVLDPSSDHYAAISKLLMQYPRVNLKGIPLFPDLFWSNSLNLKTDRLWMLHLLYTGINLEDDAQIYMKNSVLEILLSFYVSPLSDNESKELILQILQKVVKLQKIACFLVQSCGLIPWISSVLSSLLNLGDDHQDVIFRKQYTISLEIMNEIISRRGSTKWLQKVALEQLSDLAANLLNILVSGSKFVERDASLLISILKVVVSALKWSQKRKIYQPHFTLSVLGIYKLYEAVDRDSYAKCCHGAELALQAILMSSPVTIFQLSREELSRFLGWAVCTTLKSDSALVLQPNQSYPYFSAHVMEDISEDSLLSKLLRWLIASVILGRISSKKHDVCSCFPLVKPTMDTLLSLVKHFQKNCGVTGSASGSEEMLAAVIFYLQQLLGMNSKVLSSVVAALSLLLLADGFSTEGSSSIFTDGSPASLLWSKIRCPPETQPAWRWSYYQPWVDLSSEQTAPENMEESHACQNALNILLEVLSKKFPDFQLLSYQVLTNSGVFQWERSTIES